MEWVIDNWQEIILAATSVVTAASLVAKLTPNESDDKFFAAILKIIHFIAMTPKK